MDPAAFKRHVDMKLALAVEAFCNREFRTLTTAEMLTGLKFAAMLKMGIDDPVVLVAAVEGSEALAWQDILATAHTLHTAKDQQRLLSLVEQGARAIVQAHLSQAGAA